MEILKKPVDSVQYVLNETDILDIQADIQGPVGTPYSGGVFRCKLVLNNEFPKVPPKGYFLTKIFHPNVSEKGEICVNTLKKDWDPAHWSLSHIFEVIRCLLIVPFPESALNEEAGKAFMDDYEEYANHAKLITELYAMPKEKLSQPTNVSPVKKPEAMEISFENSHESPQKVFQVPTTSATFGLDVPFGKGNMNDTAMKIEKQDEVLQTVTNSYNPNPLSPLEDPLFKKSTSLPLGNMFGMGMGAPSMGMPTNVNGSMSAKKENDDKKKWRKRI